MKLKLENGTELEADLKPLTVGQYPAAFEVLKSEDEPRLMGMILHPTDPHAPVARSIPLMLTPESYEAVAAEMPNVLRRFFAYCVRRVSGRVLVDSSILDAAKRGSTGATTSPSSPSPQA